MLVSPHNTSDDTPGVPIITQLVGGDKSAEDDDDAEPTVLESTHNKSGDNKDEIKDCEDTELATKQDNKIDMGDEVESEPEDSELSSDDDEQEEMEEWFPPTNNENSKKDKYSNASHQPTKVGVALGTDFSLDGGFSS